LSLELDLRGLDGAAVIDTGRRGHGRSLPLLGIQLGQKLFAIDGLTRILSGEADNDIAKLPYVSRE
jgi:hypothetical protein